MLIRPRLTDFHGIPAAQEDLPFAVPFFDEDIPLYVDPFLLWRSPSQQDQALHTSLLTAFNQLGHMAATGKEDQAVQNLIAASECEEVGLGTSRTRVGKRIGDKKAREVIALFQTVPQYGNQGFRHFEEIQFFIDGISKDRVSDIACNYLKSFLIDFTIDQCDRLGIPTNDMQIGMVYDQREGMFTDQNVRLPANPLTGEPLLFTPKRWLRYVPWLNYDDYFEKYCPQDEISHVPEALTRVEVLSYNRDHYGVVSSYVAAKEREAADASNDPLFSQLPVRSARSKLEQIRKLDTGKGENADIRFEELVGQLLPTLLYPHLDFAQEQARTDSGVSIRDLIFYNTQRSPFLREIFQDYGSRQITFELKNVRSIDRGHVDQLNRYLADELGRFGVFVTRYPLKRPEFQRTIDLWSGQRKAIIVLTDQDLEQMVEVFDSKQRDPIDVLAKKFVEFRRACP